MGSNPTSSAPDHLACHKLLEDDTGRLVTSAMVVADLVRSYADLRLGGTDASW